jgi:WD40 repeat protein/serine/threonine protein kinase
MTVLTCCPDEQKLRCLLLGQLPFVELTHLAEHLDRCPRCVERVGRVVAEDNLTSAVRAGVAPLPPEERERVEQLMVHLYTLGSVCANVSSDSSIQPDALNARTAGVSDPNSHDGLSPPLRTDENGRLAHYRIVKKLGEGGMGAVYQAEDKQLQRFVALKVMKPELAVKSTARERFLREARAAAKLKHDHIVTIYQVGEDGGVPFLAMEYLEGIALDEVLKKDRKLSLAQVLKIGREIALGLAAAHEKGLIHRDVKPGNIWLDSSKGGRVKLLDFGLARATSDDVQLTQEGAIVGTPAYMAPEQAQAKLIDARSDLFSLGCVLYRLCAGRLPFLGETTMAVLLSLSTDTPPAIRVLNPKVPVPLAELITRLLAKNPAERPSSAQAVVEAIQAIERQSTTPAVLPISSVAVAQPAPAPDVSAEVTSVSVPVNRRPGSKLRWRVWGLAVGVALLVGGLLFWVVGAFFPPPVEHGQVVLPSNEKGLPQPPALPPQQAANRLGVLQRERIPVSERFAWQPKELVAVLGEHRGRHWGAIRCVAFSPDGKLIASGGVDQVIRLWDAATLQEKAILVGHTNRVDRIAFSPDGKMLGSGSRDDKAVRLWDVSGEEPKGLAVIKVSEGSLAFSKDGKTLATDHEKGVSLWDLGGAKPREKFVLKSVKDTYNWPAISLAFSPDGKTLAEGTSSGVRFWDLTDAEPKEKHNVAKSFNTPFALAYSPNGKLLAGNSLFRGGELWDLSGDEPRVLNFLPSGGVAFSPDGDTLAVGGQLWNMALIKPAKSAELERGQSVVAAFSPDSQSLVTGNDAGALRLWDLSGAEPKERILRGGHISPISSLAVAAGGSLVASGSGRRTNIFYGPEDKTVRVWSLQDAEFKERFVLNLNEGPVTSVAMSSDGKSLAASGKDEFIRIWNLSGSKPLEITSLDQAGSLLAFAPDGKTLATTKSREITLWDFDGSGLRTRQVLKVDSYTPYSLSFAPGGECLGAAYDSKVFLWTMRGDDRKEPQLLDKNLITQYALAVSPDGQNLALGGSDSIVRLWTIGKGGQAERDKLVGHLKDVRSVAFNPDGKSLASSGEDGRVLLWDVRTGKMSQEWKLPGPVSAVAFPDQHHLLLGNANGTLYILRLEAFTR